MSGHRVNMPAMMMMLGCEAGGYTSTTLHATLSPANSISWSILEGTFREHSGNIQGTFREHLGNIQGTFREHSGNIQGTFTCSASMAASLANVAFTKSSSPGESPCTT